MQDTEENTRKWRVNKHAKTNVKTPVLIVGLPGIGNVGKLTADFIIDQMQAEKTHDFFSDTFPHSVFVNEENLIELPTIILHQKKRKEQDFLILTGDIQPVNEQSCYAFCRTLNALAQELGVKEILTLGGIGLKEEPKDPKLYVTGNNKAFIKTIAKKSKADEELYGVVGPVLGVSGVLPGITQTKAAILLAETFGHPLYVGIKGAEKLLEALNTTYELKLDITKLQEELEVEEPKLEKTKKIQEAQQQEAQNYIG